LEDNKKIIEEQLGLKEAALAEAAKEAEAARKSKINSDSAVVVDKATATITQHFHGNVGMVLSNSNGISFSGFGGINFNK